MSMTPLSLSRLGLEAPTDELQVKRAYARLLKQIDQATEPEKFQQLRQDYQDSLAFVRFTEALKSSPIEYTVTFGEPPVDPPAAVPPTDPESIDETLVSTQGHGRPEETTPSEPQTDRSMVMVNEATEAQEPQEPQEQASILNPTDLAHRQIQELRHQLHQRNLSEVHEILAVLNQCLASDDLFSLEARGAFEMSLLSRLMQGDWAHLSGPMLCAGNLCFRWSTALRGQNSWLPTDQSRDLEALLDDLSQLDTLAIESWCRWAKMPNASPVQSLMAVENTRQKYPALSQFFFGPVLMERLESEAQNLRRPFDQFKRQVLSMTAPGIEELAPMLSPFAGDSTFEILLVQALASRHFDQTTAAVLFAAKGVFQWRTDNTDTIARYGPDGETLAKVLMEVGAFSVSGAGKWVHWAQSTAPALAREARQKIGALRPNYPHACALFFPKEYLQQLQKSEKRDVSWKGRFARVWDQLSGGGLWNVFGNLIVLAVVIGVVIKLFGVMSNPQSERNAGVCDIHISAGIESNWESLSSQDLTSLRKCLDTRRLPVMCSDRKGLKDLLELQNYLEGRFRNSDSLNLVYKPAPGRLYAFRDEPTCENHEHLVFGTEWLNAVDKTTLARSVQELGRCSLKENTQAPSKELDHLGQNGRLFQAALKLTKEWQTGVGKVSAKAISLEDLFTTPPAQSVNWNAFDAVFFTTPEPCLTSITDDGLRKMEAGPKETSLLLQRVKRNNSQ